VSGERICREDLPPEIRGSGSSGNGRITLELPSTLAEVEEKVIDRTLELTGGNRTRASELLGIGRRTLQRKLSNEENS
jgi:DNA-binding NtrC family response regulator